MQNCNIGVGSLWTVIDELPKLASPLGRRGGPSSSPKFAPAQPKFVLPRPLRVWSGWRSSYISGMDLETFRETQAVSDWSHPLHYLKGSKVLRQELDILLHCNGEAVMLEFEVDEVAYFELPICSSFVGDLLHTMLGLLKLVS